jgi:orotidine-5'-phosphate decarboxylase
MVNVHALGGRRMMEAAREAVNKSQTNTKLIAVTILTSMASEDLTEIGLAAEPRDMVGRLAALAQKSGMDGVVCSPLETGMLREQCGPDFLFVTPGVRPSGSGSDDQKRIMTPKDAILAGSNYLVIGRPVTQAANPRAALSAIFTEIE